MTTWDSFSKWFEINIFMLDLLPETIWRFPTKAAQKPSGMYGAGGGCEPLCRWGMLDSEFQTRTNAFTSKPHQVSEARETSSFYRRLYDAFTFGTEQKDWLATVLQVPRPPPDVTVSLRPPLYLDAPPWWSHGVTPPSTHQNLQTNISWGTWTKCYQPQSSLA